MKCECHRCYRKQSDKPESEVVLDHPLTHTSHLYLENPVQRLELTTSVVDLSLVNDETPSVSPTFSGCKDRCPTTTLKSTTLLASVDLKPGVSGI